MDTIEPIKICKKMYYSADELKEKCPIFFKGYRNSWSLINADVVDEQCYIFAKYEDGKWIKSTSQSKKFNKVFLLDYWVESNIPEFNSNLEYEITQAPDILKLKNSEKFKDDKGNIIDIEVRGNKNDSECYFLVKDVASGFYIKRLFSILLNFNSGYEIKTHYVYFNIIKQKNDKTIVKKELFLTHLGFVRLIHRSRINNVKYKKTVHRWLSQFKSKTPEKFVLNIEKMSKESRIGFTYLVSSPLLNAVKIGAWRSTLISLRSRYITGYGEDLSLFAIKTADAFALEKKCHKHFTKHKLTNELYDKQHYNEYVIFPKKNKEDYDIELESDIDKSESDIDDSESDIDSENDIDSESDIDDSETDDEEELENPIKTLSSFQYCKNEATDIFGNIKIISDTVDFYLCVSDVEKLIGNKNNYNQDSLIFVKKNYGKELYIKYVGLLEFVFTTNSTKESIVKLRKWMCNTLNTVQMGTKSQKNQLIASMTGVSPEAIKAVFSKTSSTLPCIYFFTIGKVKDLRKSLKISKDYDDEDIIGKYGMTKDLDRRTGEHNDTYGQLPGSDFRLTVFNFIDVQYMSQAETDLKLYMKDTILI
ncbi:unknown [Acanthamoeba polyphaga mimivirus]|uniref:Uncharacterized protein R865 n=1 Tax=Acanthamoeba polyphaga mimivirus TaxID=212035 RepID=YR865_MIMIV|nr:RecName: Full=Uncharacterized protein R865 [Acanthamoeba polyphaga mimivirus]AAV51123.1 unknown [Acanthamoeba polyphaga mimivirus]